MAQIMSSEPKFYVYEHLRVDDGSVFYVGKGCGKRSQIANRHHRSKFWQNIVQKAGGFQIKIVSQFLDEELSFLVEMERIDQLRRQGIKLCNLTNGGDGISGLIRTAEHSRKIGDAHRGKIVSEETRKKISEAVKKAGYKQSAEALKKISEANKGHHRNIGRIQSEAEKLKRANSLRGRVGSRLGTTQSEEAKRKISLSHLGVPQKKIECPHCLKQGGNTMRRYHFDFCKQRIKNGTD